MLTTGSPVFRAGDVAGVVQMLLTSFDDQQAILLYCVVALIPLKPANKSSSKAHLVASTEPSDRTHRPYESYVQKHHEQAEVIGHAFILSRVFVGIDDRICFPKPVVNVRHRSSYAWPKKRPSAQGSVVFDTNGHRISFRLAPSAKSIDCVGLRPSRELFPPLSFVAWIAQEPE